MIKIELRRPLDKKSERIDQHHTTLILQDIDDAQQDEVKIA